MTFSEVKKFIYELVKRYHPGAMVVWTKTKGVTPKPPYITLGYSNLNRSAFPLSDDEREHRYYNYDFIFEINLYTVGKEVKAGNGSYFENTAVEDLEEFIRFLDSDGITERNTCGKECLSTEIYYAGFRSSDFWRRNAGKFFISGC